MKKRIAPIYGSMAVTLALCLMPLLAQSNAATGASLSAISEPVASQHKDEWLHREALYAFHINDYINTLTLLENEHQGGSEVSNDFHNRNHLLSVETLLRFGLEDEVKPILEHLAFTARDNSDKKTSQLMQGKLAFGEKKYDEAARVLLEALKRKKRSAGLSKDDQDQALYFLSRSYLAMGDVAKAAKILGAVTEGSMWAGYGYYNLGVYYATNDPEKSRAFVSFRVAEAMTDSSTEGQELNDKVQLAAGHLALQEKDFDKALSFLKNVRVGSVSAAAAIYDYGRAYAGLGRYRTAIQSWHRAKKYALVVPGVAESFQAIAYGYEQEELRATAIDAYLEAIDVYEKELRQIDSIVSSISKNGLLQLLEDVANQDNQAEWFLATDLATNTPKAAFTNFLMAEDTFYPDAKQLMQLSQLSEVLKDGVHRLSVLEQTLGQRSRDIDGKARKGLRKLDESRLNRLITERNRLAQAISAADERHDYQAVSKNGHTGAVKKMEGIEAKLRELSGKLTHEEVSEFRKRLRRLEGVQLWQAMDEFNQNRKALLGQMQDIDQRLSTLKENYVRVRDELTRGKQHFKGKVAKVSQLRQKFESKLAVLEATIRELDGTLRDRAVQLLRAHRQQVDEYNVRSQLALVNLYEELALAELQRKQNVDALQSGAGEEAL